MTDPPAGRARPAHSARRLLAVLLALPVAFTGACTIGGKGHTARSGPSVEGPYRTGNGTLRVLASSELADLKPVLDDVARATGVTVALTETGTLDGVQSVVDGRAAMSYDAIWFASNHYLELNPGAGGRTGTSTKVATSPVVLGLRPEVAQKLGWDKHRPSWSEIATAAGAKQFTYGMTNPASSNSGYSALVGVAAALAGTGSALTTEQIRPLVPRLRAFFTGQSLTAGSSGWLADAYRRSLGDGRPVDGLVNYESVLLSLNASGTLPQPLTLIYPADGVVSADYPLTLLSSGSEQARANYAAVIDYLRRPSTQRTIMAKTFRRPAVPGVPLDGRFGPPSGSGGLPELPFPTKFDAANALITTFSDSLRNPPLTVYVLDLSGSMKGERIAGLRSALVGLTGADQSLAGQFTRFSGRERAVMLPFSTRPGQPRRFDVPETDFGPTMAQIQAYAGGLVANGDTAIYDALGTAYDLVGRLLNEDPQRIASIVLLTDGERTVGADLAAFTAKYAGLAPTVQAVPVFPILFGEGNTAEMTQIATTTGGKTFDARTGTLAAAFRDIRGYQ
jgi:Ca-activated chloride channel family protein